jgi:sugar/nucleoside kinase (ribokinase family)
MFDVVSVGSATQDVFIKSDLTKIIRVSDVVAQKEFLCYDYGSKVNIDNILFLTGGGASNTAVSFARLGLKSAFAGKVGRNDDAGARVVRELESEGVDVRYAKYSNTYSTGYSVILVSYEGDRTVLTFRGANNSLDESDIDASLFGEASWLYMSALSGRSAEMATALARQAKEAGVKLAFNPGSSQLKTRIKGLRDILAATEILIMNRQEAEAVTGVEASRRHVDTEACNLCGKCVDACPSGIFQKADNSILVRNTDLCLRCGKCAKACPRDAITAEPWTYNLREIFAALLDAGTKLVVITDGKSGSQASDGETIYMFPAYTAPTVDTLGAGDAFGSAFLAGMIRGAGVAKALQMGAANGSSVVRYFGAKPGLLTLQEIEDFIAGKSSEEVYYVRTEPVIGSKR